MMIIALLFAYLYLAAGAAWFMNFAFYFAKKGERSFWGADERADPTTRLLAYFIASAFGLAIWPLIAALQMWGEHIKAKERAAAPGVKP